MKRFHFLANVYRSDAIAASRIAAKSLVGQGFAVAGDSETASAIGVPVVEKAEFGRCDLCLAYGGDGTLIHAAHLCCESGTPILGVYFGRFGFVTQAANENVASILTEFLAGKSVIEKRMMLKTTLVRQKQEVATLHALNEVAVQRSVTVRMLSLNVRINGTELTTYPADGILVSTPTGSTGYNLSAGGPIMDPDVEALTLSALAPHTLSARPLVLNPESRIEITLEGVADAMLSADNSTHLHVLAGDKLIIQRSEFTTCLIQVRSNDFLYKLANRLFWSQHV